VRGDLLLGEVAHDLAEVLVFLAQLEHVRPAPRVVRNAALGQRRFTLTLT
jgi:hypothetical protein